MLSLSQLFTAPNASEPHPFPLSPPTSTWGRRSTAAGSSYQPPRTGPRLPGRAFCARVTWSAQLASALATLSGFIPPPL
eukprot:7204551-Lingulodinium_polyedra.AAC.1